MRSFNTIILSSAAFMALSASIANAQVFDPSSEFSLAGNPSGVFSYGYSTSLGGALVLHTQSANFSGLAVWNSPFGGEGSPSVAFNTLATDIVGTTMVFEAKTLAAHPGINGEFQLIRFTVPSDGSYHVAGAFWGADFAGPTTTDVHVLANGATVFDGSINSSGPDSRSSFDSTVSLLAGDTIDFVVGFGSNGNYFFDTTALTTTITAVPEPSTIAIFASLGLVGFAAWRRMKVQQA